MLLEWFVTGIILAVASFFAWWSRAFGDYDLVAGGLALAVVGILWWFTRPQKVRR